MFIRPLADMKAAADPAVKAVEDLTTMTKHDVNRLIEEVRRNGSNPEQKQVVDAALKDAYENLEHNFQNMRSKWANMPDGAAKDGLRAQMDKVKYVRDTVRPADLDLSSGWGSTGRYRVGGFNTNEWRDISEESILREMGVENPHLATPEQLAKAETQYSKLYDQRVAMLKDDSELKSLSKQIDDAFASNDHATAIKLGNDRGQLLDAKLARDAEGTRSVGQYAKDVNSSAIKKITEWVISTVFSPGTVVRNTLPSLLKTLYRPALDYVMRGPFDPIHFKMMLAQYSTMAMHMDNSFNGAHMAWKIERGMISGDYNKITEGMAPAFKGQGGKLLRFFPRILGATDEFFQQMNYRGFVAANATADAMKFGMAQKLTGKALNDFVKAETKDAVEQSFGKVDGTKVLDLLRQKANDYKIPVGPKRDAWMKTMLDKDKDLFREALNQSAKDYSDDVLFKRQFSGTNSASQIAKGYEKFVNQHPMMRLMGQLFFRTPVRVFEEGIRLTAGVNLFAGLVTGTFIKDLKGLSGKPQQLRAQGELMLSYGIAMAVFSMYGQGKLTGGGSSDWRLRRQEEDTKRWEPYTFRFGDNSTFNFRNWDPFATPFKILVNGLDRYNTILYRQAQGEYLDNDEKKAMAMIGMATLSIGQAVRDAQLWTGLDQGVQLIQDAMDPEAKEDKIIKWLGQKVKLIVPNTVTKYQAFDQPELNDPATLEQYIRGAVNPADPLVAKRYDTFGKVQMNDNPLGGMTGLDFGSRKVEDTKAQRNAEEIKNLTVATEKKFLMPYSVNYIPGWAGVDLRKEMTKDGKTTYYDRLNEYVGRQRINGMSLEDYFYKHVTSNTSGSYGTLSGDGSRGKAASTILNGFRALAFKQLLSEETGIKPKAIAEMMKERDILKGLRDAGSQPLQ